MKGSESLFATARAAGVEVCFANPGTTEMPLVEAFDDAPGVRPVLALHEGVVTGAADGYARMLGRPAMTLLHLGPGLANGIANLHNARRAHSPVVNVVGDQASWHQVADPPLSSDIESLARPVSGWVGRTTGPENTAEEFVLAWQAAVQQRLPATLITAADHLWSQGGEPAEVPAAASRPETPHEQITELAEFLSSTRGRIAFLLGGNALTGAGLRAAARIAAKTNGELIAEQSPTRQERGPGIPIARRLPYFPGEVLELLSRFQHLVLVGTRTPVAFFGYRGMPSHPIPADMKVHQLATPEQDAEQALQQLAEAVSAPAEVPEPERAEPAEPRGELSPEAVAAAITATQPEQAIVVNEGVSAANAYSVAAESAPPHTELTNTGGAIGMGLPLATGAALACPDRPVITFEADGSACYTVQALWTQAREGLNVVTVVLANSAYRILQTELSDGSDRPSARQLTTLDHPEISWTDLARGFGVPAARATTGEELLNALQEAHSEPGPQLIEAVL